MRTEIIKCDLCGEEIKANEPMCIKYKQANYLGKWETMEIHYSCFALMKQYINDCQYISINRFGTAMYEGIKAQCSICEYKESEKNENVYIKIYADSKPEEIAEKIYCICDKEELNQIIEALKEYMEDKEE